MINPAPPNNPSQPPATTILTITDPTQPAISSVVNSGSFLPAAVQTGTDPNPVPQGATAVSPREIISIFGQNLGPSTVSTTTPSGTPGDVPHQRERNPGAVFLRESRDHDSGAHHRYIQQPDQLHRAGGTGGGDRVGRS